jgi:GT2 family glycosyltransferase
MVTCRSGGVIAAALASFRDEVHRLGIRAELVLVDHSEDPAEADRLLALAPDTLLVKENRGYAAGINAGVAASAGRVILAGNPDVIFVEGSVAALLHALDEGWDIVGPQFTLAGLLFPPADLQTPGEQFRRWLAGRSRFFWQIQFRRELGRWRAIWDAARPVAVPTLSGALLAFRRETFERVGPWDEGYFLYFEETDWLRRAAAAGLRLAHVPSARVEHVWGHAANPAAAGDIFAASRARFLSAHFGWRGRLAAWLPGGRAPLEVEPLQPEGGKGLPDGALWWLVSPTALGLPAAGLLGNPAEVIRALRNLSSMRDRSANYLVCASDPATGSFAGPWSWGGWGG